MKSTRKFRRFKRYEFTTLTGLARIPKHGDLRKLPFIVHMEELSVDEIRARYPPAHEHLEIEHLPYWFAPPSEFVYQGIERTAGPRSI